MTKKLARNVHIRDHVKVDDVEYEVMNVYKAEGWNRVTLVMENVEDKTVLLHTVGKDSFI